MDNFVDGVAFMTRAASFGLCQGVRMNDSCSGISCFSQHFKRKIRIKLVFDALRGRVVTSADLSASLLGDLMAKMCHLGYFFVAFLKFPPIVQSGSILFRKLDQKWAGRGAGLVPHWLRCSCVANDIIILQSDRKSCNFLMRKKLLNESGLNRLRLDVYAFSEEKKSAAVMDHVYIVSPVVNFQYACVAFYWECNMHI